LEAGERRNRGERSDIHVYGWGEKGYIEGERSNLM